ncbi:hypothetical protein NJG23_00005, partial [Pseudomonas asiatica]|uniref:hypothetical protein n=1 Tax=Pseudomonas asiatica TaxID=2219225 RepID=UPI00209B9181
QAKRPVNSSSNADGIAGLFAARGCSYKGNAVLEKWLYKHSQTVFLRIIPPHYYCPQARRKSPSNLSPAPSLQGERA